MEEVVATQAQLPSSHHDRSNPTQRCMAWAAPSSSDRSKQQLIELRGYKRAPPRRWFLYTSRLQRTSEVTHFLVLARVEQRQHRDGEAAVEQTELQAAVHVRAVGRGQPEGRGRHAAVFVVVVVRQGVQVRL